MQGKCTQKPSRVPGVRHAACTRPLTRRATGSHAQARVVLVIPPSMGPLFAALWPASRRRTGRVHQDRPRAGRGLAPRGSAGSSAHTATPVASETRPVPANEGVQPAVCSSRVSGIVAARLPAMPSIEVTDTASGNRRGAKSWAAKRTTLTNVIASPQPRMARASRAPG
jgi:hypothetical protein